MLDKPKLDEFRATLESNRMYDVGNAHYAKAMPRDMSYHDLAVLQDRKRSGGEAALIENSITYHSGIIL